jgi:hypothetical protein
MHAYERHAYGMAFVGDTPMIDAPMRWPMRDARLWETHLWDGLCEKHAYETPMRGTPIKCPSIGDILIPERYL